MNFLLGFLLFSAGVGLVFGCRPTATVSVPASRIGSLSMVLPEGDPCHTICQAFCENHSLNHFRNLTAAQCFFPETCGCEFEQTHEGDGRDHSRDPHVYIALPDILKLNTTEISNQ